MKLRIHYKYICTRSLTTSTCTTPERPWGSKGTKRSHILSIITTSPTLRTIEIESRKTRKCSSVCSPFITKTVCWPRWNKGHARLIRKGGSTHSLLTKKIKKRNKFRGITYCCIITSKERNLWSGVNKNGISTLSFTRVLRSG